MKNKLFIACAGLLLCQHILSQEYTFQLSVTNATADKTEHLDNGATYMTFPAGTDLNALGLTCTVPEGTTVSPDPSTARIRDNEVEIFTVTYADGTKRAFPYYFTAGRWFTVILFGDPEVNLTDRYQNNATEENLSKWANCIVNMKTSGRYAFSTNPNITPSPDLVVCMGDMDGDSEKSGSAFKNVFNVFNNNGIPFITMVGNHDVVPDYWSGENGGKGLTWGLFGSGGSDCNDVAFGIVTNYLSSAQNYGVENVQRFTQSNGDTQPQPFTFTFKGVRFYVGQTYWFQKPYNKPDISSDATYYAPNGIIESLSTFVEANKETPSVWIQHYPINCEDRWWLDQNDVGRSIDPSDTPTYKTAAEKRNKYMELISKTKNPYHFSGHNHTQATITHSYNGKMFNDYIAPYFATEGGAWMILCHEGEGVKEVQSVTFNY